MKRVTLFYRNHHSSYRFALITKKQIEESNLEVKLDLVDLDKMSHTNYMMEAKKADSIPDIIYVWETEYLALQPACAYPSSFIKSFLMDLYPETHIETYSYKDREELFPDEENNMVYDYKLSERIKRDIDILNDIKDYLIINKETLRVESHAFKNKYWIEDYLYFHPYCEIVETKEEGEKILKIIAEERINTLQKEAEIIKADYKNRIHQLAIEIDKLKNVIEKL